MLPLRQLALCARRSATDMNLAVLLSGAALFPRSLVISLCLVINCLIIYTVLLTFQDVQKSWPQQMLVTQSAVCK
jgi:hypothetical protein